MNMDVQCAVYDIGSGVTNDPGNGQRSIPE